MTTTYTICSVKGAYTVTCDTLNEAISEALIHDAEYRPAYGTHVLDAMGIVLHDTAGNLIWCSRCREAVEPEEDDRGCGCHCPQCNATL